MHQFYSLCSQIIGGIVVCLLIISFSVTLTLNFRPLYYADIQNLHITELSGREEKDIRSNYDALIDYNSLFNHHVQCPNQAEFILRKLRKYLISLGGFL